MSNVSISMPASACVADSIVPPVLLGAEILNIEAAVVANYSGTSKEEYNYNHPTIVYTDLTYCNVTVTYTHPGQNDTINVENWLPLDNYNGRLQSAGGGGWVSGRFFISYTSMAGAVAQGYAASTTDAGLWPIVYTPDTWAQVSEGNVNMYNIQNLGSVALHDQAVIAKSVIASFYGSAPSYSYWSGCSQGGRQGMELAQRYPGDYDGIAASAPAFNWNTFIPTTSWTQVMMNIRKDWPRKCELDYITQAAIDYCDPLDGITDGIISLVDQCDFDPYSLVGESFNCTDTNLFMDLTEGAAYTANITWTGPTTSSGRRAWYGPNLQSRLTGATVNTGTTADLGYAMTTCTANGTCSGVDAGLGDAWLTYFVNKNTTWDDLDITSQDEFVRMMHHAQQQFDSIIGTNDPDLTEFRDAGSKMITYHGLADGLIPSRGTDDYYNKSVAIDSNLNDYWRYFQVPGMDHCSGGVGGQPTATWQLLVDWVEKGIAPDTMPISFNSSIDGVLNTRILCPYPARAVLKANATNTTTADSFECSS